MDGTTGRKDPKARGRCGDARSRCQGSARDDRVPVTRFWAFVPPARIIGSSMVRITARVLALALAAGLLAPACRSGSPSSVVRPKLLILGFDGMDPALLTRWMKAADAPEPVAAGGHGGVTAAGDDALAGVADGVGVVCHRRQSRQAQHLRLPGPRHGDLPARPRHGAPRAGALPVRLPPDREAEAAFRFAAARRSGSPPASAGVRSQHPHGAGDVPARRRAERRAALRPAAARHPRHDGDLLLLRHRPEPLRGRQHRVRRHPQAAGDGAATSRSTELVGPPNPIVRAEDSRRCARKGAAAERSSDRATIAELQAQRRRPRCR